MRPLRGFLSMMAFLGLAFLAVLWLQSSTQGPGPAGASPSGTARAPLDATGSGSPSPKTEESPMTGAARTETATLGGGCFWCVEAIFREVRGVTSVEPGYAGGSVANPTYEQVCRKDTGHAEVVQVHFDPAVVSYPQILEIFFLTHDPTTRDRQGADVGPQYRSVVFYHDPTQKAQAEEVRSRARGWWEDPVVTAIEPFTAFYPAEVEHRDYYARNPQAPYCRLVIAPKIRKLQEKFRDRLKAAPQPAPE